jgi:predicted ATPase/DNA-binding XRE family transcriptional regulator
MVTPSLGAWLRERRRVLDWTQEELAEQVGCTRGTIYKLEAGQRRPSKAMVERLAQVLSVPLEEYANFVHLARIAGVDEPAQEQPPENHQEPETHHRAISSPALLAEDECRQRLPIPLTPLIGREALLEELCSRLRSPEARLLTLTGAPGIGKTRLALAVAARLCADFSNGAAFVPLAALSDAAFVAAEIAQGLGAQAEHGPDTVEHLQRVLRHQQLLLVLDNFEHLIEAAPLVTALLSQAPGLKILVTSREVLRLSGEREIPVPPLTLPLTPHQMASVGDEANTIASSPAVELFVQRAQEARHDFQVTSENAPILAQLCAYLDGLPLAIELAAPHIRLFSPRMMLDRLTAAKAGQATPKGMLSLLRSGSRDAPSRQQTLQAALEWSYQLLSATEQRLFARLAIFVGGFTLDAADEVCGVVGDQALDILAGLGALVQKSLLQRSDSTDEPRFLMLEPIRHYALTQLALLREEETLRRQHTAYFLRLAEQATLMGSSQLRRLDREHGNLRAALEWCHINEQAGRGAALSLAQALGLALHSQTRYAEAVEVFQAMCMAAEAVNDHIAIAHACNNLAWAYDRRGAHREALECASRSEAIARGADAQREQARALSLKSQALYRLGELDAALAEATAGIQLCSNIQPPAPAELAANLNILGSIQIFLGQHEQATATLTQALGLYRSLSDRSRVAGLLNNLGECARLSGDPTRSIGFYAEALAISREIGDRNNEILILSNLGGARVAAREYQAAEADLRALIQQAEISKWVGISEAYSFLAEAYLGQSKLDEALVAAQRALALALAHDEALLIGTAWRALGMVVARSEGPLLEGLGEMTPDHCFHTSLQTFAAAKMVAEQARTLAEWARAAQLQGDQGRVEERSHEARPGPFLPPLHDLADGIDLAPQD